MKYDELMDKIEVTDAMRARILRNVSAAAPKKTPVRRYALLAACLAVVLLGAVCVPKLMDPAPQGVQVAIANGMIEVADAAVLFAPLPEVNGIVAVFLDGLRHDRRFLVLDLHGADGDLSDFVF